MLRVINHWSEKSYIYVIDQIMKIVSVVRKAVLKDIDEELEDMRYWLSRPAHERMAAVTQLISKSLKPGQRMDKTVVIKRNLHP